MRLVFMLPYTDLLLATKQQSVSVSIELSVEDNPWTFLEPVQTQCQHLQYKSSWDIFYGIEGPLELDLKHWTTASEACSKCKAITLWGHFASILFLDVFHVAHNAFTFTESESMRVTLQWRVQGTCWRGQAPSGLQHRMRHFSKVEQHQQEQQATSSPTALTGLLSHMFLEGDLWRSIWGNWYPHPLALAETTDHEGGGFSLILSFPTQPAMCASRSFPAQAVRALWLWARAATPQWGVPNSSLHPPACVLNPACILTL